jgi:hypothetical protein
LATPSAQHHKLPLHRYTLLGPGLRVGSRHRGKQAPSSNVLSVHSPMLREVLFCWWEVSNVREPEDCRWLHTSNRHSPFLRPARLHKLFAMLAGGDNIGKSTIVLLQEENSHVSPGRQRCVTSAEGRHGSKLAFIVSVPSCRCFVSRHKPAKSFEW